MTETDYTIKLQTLRQKNPFHDIIPVLDEMGYCPLAKEYLKLALEDPLPERTEHVTANSLYDRKSHLYSKRAVESNKFHTCRNDAERRAISIGIGAIQAEIIDVKRAIENYENTGALPKADHTPKVKLIDGSAKKKKIKSLMSSVSRFKALLLKETDEEKIADYREKITKLKDELIELGVKTGTV